MAGQVAKLTFETAIKGFEEVQGLGKALKQINVVAGKSDKQFLSVAKRVKEFANANRNSVNSIRGQIVALDKLKQSAMIGGKAYKSLSKDIIALNTQLLTLANTEKIAQQTAASAALVERDAQGRRLDDQRVNRGQLLSTGQLLGQVGGVNVVRGDVFERRIASFAESMKGLEVTQNSYKTLLDLLITTTRNFNNAQATATNLVSNKNAMGLVRGEIDKRREALRSPYSITRESPSPLAMQGPWDVGQYKREYAEKPYWEKFFKNFAHTYLGYTSKDLAKALDDVVVAPEVPGARSGLRAGQLAGLPFDKDPYKNILPTSASYRTEIAKLDDQLEHLTHNSEEYNTVAKQKAKLEKELAKATKQSVEEQRKGFRTDRRTRGRGQVYRDTSGVMIGRGQSFALPPGIESGAMQTVQTLKEFVAEQEKLNITGKSNINTLVKTRQKFDEIRNTLDPTSKRFKEVTKAIAATDKALLRLSNNKFSGANLRRTGQSILGAGFVGGPAGFLGAGLGAGIEALRPGGDMAGGAITGGLVASQVLTPITQAVGGATTYASDIAKANIALQGITKTTENYDVAQQAITKAVEVYNVPQEVAIKGMTRLSAAVLGAGGNIHNAAEAFLNTTVAIKGTAGSADDVKSAITAMVQIYSKGKVSAEELSGQLGERFPAAVTKFAKANDISTQALQKNLKDGTVGLDMLSKFVTSLGKEYAPLAEEIAKSNEEAGARAQIAMNKMKIAVGTDLKDVGAEFQIIGAELSVSLIPALKSIAMIGAATFSGLAAIISGVVDNFHEIASILAIVGAAFAAAAIQAKGFTLALAASKIQAAHAGIVKMAAALRIMTIAQIKANIAAYANPYVALAAGLTAAAIAAHRFATLNDRLAAQLNSGTATEDDVTKALKRRLDIQRQITDLESNKSKRGGASRANRIRDLKEDYDALTEAIEAYRNGQTGVLEDMEKLTKKFSKMLSEGQKTYSGLQGGWEKFADSVKNIGEEVANVTASWFDRAADSLANFVMTGKFQFKEFARSIIADIAKMIAKQMIFNMIAGLTGGKGGWFSKLTGGGGGGGADVNNAKGNVFAQNGIVPYAKGGIVNKPTFFPFSKGTGLMGEAGPEAIIPLQRGRDGKLGVAGGGGSTTVNVSVDAKGSKVEGDGKQMAQLGKLLGSAIEMEIAKQKRPGGLLT
tara:strand:- start:2567 stop:6097 length:3531 start_codon:yes stop_codon:yes gene_type:complete